MYRTVFLLEFVLVNLAWAQESDRIPVSQVINLAGWMRYPIFAVLVVGIALVVAEYLKLRISFSQARNLLDAEMGEVPLESLEEMVQAHSDNSILKLFGNLFAHVRLTSSVTNFNSDLGFYNRTMHDRFNSFKNWMSFLSDAAGALGLLGTVLGMFQTFFGGTLAKEKILNGMGVALVTTLLGLIVSLVLNFLTTVVVNRFNRQQDQVLMKADAFRDRVLREKQRNGQRES